MWTSECCVFLFSFHCFLRRFPPGFDHFVMLQLNAVDPFYFDVSFIYWSFNVDKDVYDDDCDWWWCEKMCVVIYILYIALGCRSPGRWCLWFSGCRHLCSWCVFVIKCGYLSFRFFFSSLLLALWIGRKVWERNAAHQHSFYYHFLVILPVESLSDDRVKSIIRQERRRKNDSVALCVGK